MSHNTEGPVHYQCALFLVEMASNSPKGSFLLSSDTPIRAALSASSYVLPKQVQSIYDQPVLAPYIRIFMLH